MPLHLLTTASLRALGRLNPASRFDRRRFRPNFLIEPEAGTDELVESAWSGATLRVGGATVKVEMPTPRCSMTTQPQADLAKDPAVLRTVVRHANQNLGVYAGVVEPGHVAVGDPVERG
ncbi:MAG: MOSC domain-containing protein [Deltaproteobacteria bacterium]|nr:MAG: MOSC domain-containing protein [Deltaproteobacteria bacterium]